MKIKLLSNVAIDGIVRKPGDEVEVSRSVGLDLIGRKRAESLEAPKESKVITSEGLGDPEEKPKRGRQKADGE